MRKEDWKQSKWNRGWDHCYGWKVEWKVDRAQVEEEEEEEGEATSQLVTANNLTHTCSHSAQKRVEDAVHSVHRTALILNNRFTLKWTNIWKQSGKTNQENNNHVSKVNNRENVKDFKLIFLWPRSLNFTVNGRGSTSQNKFAAERKAGHCREES